jgi:hypothetical protein
MDVRGSGKPDAVKRDVFVSYRRADSAGWTGRLVADLRQRFPGLGIFMDLQTVPAGRDFRAIIDDALACSGVVLVVIGPHWLSLRDAHGTPRLSLPGDLVCIEVARALALVGTRVIPVLVGGARMPNAEELPEALSPLARLHALELSDSRWEHDLARLAHALEESGVRPGRRRIGRNAALATIALSAAVGGAIAWQARQADTPAAGEQSRMTSEATDRPATAPGVVNLNGLWAGEFVRRQGQPRRTREMLQLEVEGDAVYGRNWVEVLEDGATKPESYRPYSLVDGKIEGDLVTFCIHLTDFYDRQPIKFRQCFRGRIGGDHIAFRATNYLDHPRVSPVEEKFIARRVDAPRTPSAASTGSTRETAR